MNARFWQDGESVQVTCDAHGRPLSFHWSSETHAVEQICNRWRVDDGWWRSNDQGWREYIKLITENGLLCLLAHDLAQDRWVLVRVYD